MNGSPGEHRLLVARVQAGDQKAQAELVECLTPLVRAFATRLAGPGERDDLFQAGMIGLLKAARRYNCNRETRFTTYAVPWIQGEIRAYRRLYRPGITVSRSDWDKWRALDKTRLKLVQARGEEPGLAELAAAVGISAEEIALILEVCRPVLPLEEEYTRWEQWNEPALLDHLLLHESISKLSPLERCLVFLRFYEECTQTEIARRLELSQRQVSRLEKRILRRLRQWLAP